MFVLLERFARSVGGRCFWRERNLRDAEIFLKRLFKNADITKRYLRELYAGNPGPVEAGLLANRIFQPPSMCLNRRVRQQAGSYSFAFTPAPV
jgi:hypothetical protein